MIQREEANLGGLNLVPLGSKNERETETPKSLTGYRINR